MKDIVRREKQGTKPLDGKDEKVAIEFINKYWQRIVEKWIETVQAAQWKSHAELKSTFPSADYVKNGRYVFNIGGNNYRLVAVVIFIGGVMNIRFIGTHSEYDKIDSSTI